MHFLIWSVTQWLCGKESLRGRQNTCWRTEGLYDYCLLLVVQKDIKVGHTLAHMCTHTQNEDLIYSIGNYTQYFVITYKEKEYIYICI